MRKTQITPSTIKKTFEDDFKVNQVTTIIIEWEASLLD